VRYDPPLVEATLLRRYKRFLVDVRFPDGRVETAHTSNTGRMTGCATPGATVLLAPLPPRAKLAWSWKLVRVGRAWVNVDTQLPNRLVVDALRRGRVPELAGYGHVRAEAPCAGHRFDARLDDPSGARPPCWVEVKNVTLREGRLARFPDAPSERGLAHLELLATRVAAGERAVLLPFVARADCDAFAAAPEVDPAWAAALERAAAAGVEVLPWQARIDRRSIRLGRPLPWRREPRDEALTA